MAGDQIALTRERLLAGDPLRGLSALGVLGIHVGYASLVQPPGGIVEGDPVFTALKLQFGPAGLLACCGQWGLTMFFVLSGYLIARPWLAAFLTDHPLPSRRRYLRDRLLRIVPAFWAAALLTLAVFGPLGTSFGGVLAVFGFAGIYSESAFRDHIGQSWSLTPEMTFYLLLPVAFLILVRLAIPLRGRRGRATLVVGAIALMWLGSVAYIRFLIPTHPSLGDTTGFPAVAFNFVPGITVAAAEILGRECITRHARRWLAPLLALSAVACVAVLTEVGHIDWQMEVAVSACAGLLLLACLVRQWRGEGCWRLLDNAPLRALGYRSYCFYLVHLGVLILIVERAGVPHHAWRYAAVVFPATLVVTLIVAEVLHRLVERPFLRLRHRASAVGARSTAGERTVQSVR